ncbi:MAG: class IV adenylate cyclase [Haloarculaceae archaeon]
MDNDHGPAHGDVDNDDGPAHGGEHNGDGAAHGGEHNGDGAAQGKEDNGDGAAQAKEDNDDGEDDPAEVESRGATVEGLAERSDTTTITYKGPLLDEESKTRREAETTVGDAEQMRAVLGGLGFEPAATVRKRRRRFAYEGYTICLDDVEELGQFVEVERTAKSVTEAREGAYSVLEDLGLDPADGIRTSYLGLLLDGGENASEEPSG